MFFFGAISDGAQAAGRGIGLSAMAHWHCDSMCQVRHRSRSTTCWTWGLDGPFECHDGGLPCPAATRPSRPRRLEHRPRPAPGLPKGHPLRLPIDRVGRPLRSLLALVLERGDWPADEQELLRHDLHEVKVTLEDVAAAARCAPSER